MRTDKVHANISPLDIDRAHMVGKANSSNTADEATGSARVVKLLLNLPTARLASDS